VTSSTGAQPPESDVADRIDAVRERIQLAGGDPERVTIVAVTKGFGPGAVQAAVDAGLVDVGENYARELRSKHAALADRSHEIRWHFLGAIQRNKVAALAPLVDCWQSIGRAVEGSQIARHAPGARVLVQVSFAPGTDRPGVEPSAVPSLVEELGALGLDVAGLMAVAPVPPSEARAAFRTLRRLVDGLGLAVCSMGMTEDLELAVREGSTMVRVGRALFGDRPMP
jgi:PLP dependent protein